MCFDTIVFPLKTSPAGESQWPETLPQHPQRLRLGSVTNAVRTGRSHVTWSNMGAMSAGNRALQITIQPIAHVQGPFSTFKLFPHFLLTLATLSSVLCL